MNATTDRADRTPAAGAAIRIPNGRNRAFAAVVGFRRATEGDSRVIVGGEVTVAVAGGQVGAERSRLLDRGGQPNQIPLPGGLGAPAIRTL